MLSQFNIQNRLALVLWGSILFAFVVAGVGLLIYQETTLEQRALDILRPYAQLVSVGTDTAVAFEDPRRAREILDTLRANPQIREAELYLEDGRVLASFSHTPNNGQSLAPGKEEGIYIGQDRLEMLQRLPSGALLRISMGLAQLNEQTQQILWIFSVGALILLIATVAQLVALRQMIVRPIATLTNAAEHVRIEADYKQRVPAKGRDEVARLGRSFNAMMDAIQEKQGLLLEAQHIAHLGNWWHDLVTNEIYWSDEFFRILGREPQRPTMETLFAWVYPDDVTPLKQALETSSCNGNEQEQEFRIVRPSGEIRWVQNRWKGVFDQHGVEVKRVGTHQDITEHKRAEEQTRIAATAFEAQEGIIITDLEQRILRVNSAYSEITGYKAEEVIGAKPDLFKSDLHDKAYFEEMWDAILSEGAWQGEIWNRRKDGSIYPAWLNITAVKNQLGVITHYVGTMTDITERKEAEKKIQHLAFYDLLTDLPNRRLLIDRLRHAMMGCARSRRKGALLFIDLDNFKILNDTYGHDIGDQLLIEVAHRLTICVREGDTISRIGGDEFVIMLEDLSGNPSEAAAQTRIVGEKILSMLNRPYNMADRTHHSTPSIGATLFTGRESAVDELLKQADIAMYQAKTAGRNTLRFFDPEMQANIAIRANIEAALRASIREGGFVLHYQAQVDSQRNVIAAEALLRWLHPEQGLLLPADFIPMAEESDLILPIGQWVLENACRQLAAWSQDPHYRRLDMSINTSALQFHQKDFVDRVRRALVNSKAPATHLKLELTETMVLGDIKDSIQKMHALKALGVGLSMDDFGTGYSSLAYLTRLPLDQLKIDRSFISNLPDNSTDAIVVQTIITLAQSLGLSVVAEGVETEAQREFLERHHCPLYQGYLFSKPMELAHFEASLRERKALRR